MSFGNGEKLRKRSSWHNFGRSITREIHKTYRNSDRIFWFLDWLYRILVYFSEKIFSSLLVKQINWKNVALDIAPIGWICHSPQLLLAATWARVSTPGSCLGTSIDACKHVIHVYYSLSNFEIRCDVIVYLYLRRGTMKFAWSIMESYQDARSMVTCSEVRNLPRVTSRLISKLDRI